MQRINEEQIRITMDDAEIQSVSFASAMNKENIAVIPIGEDQEKFGAASLSKPVFTYLVLKLINAGILKLDTKLNEATNYNEQTQKDQTVLSFADFCNNVGINWIDSKENRDRVNQFTPALILSHQTGLPIGYNDRPDPQYENKPAPLKFDFEPSEKYGYSGLHLMYLQQWIEEKTGKKLEELASKYVFIPADMTHSSFNNPKANAANSLFTTAEDYVRFCLHWMQDNDPLVQQAFTSKVSLTRDPWAIREHVAQNTLKHLAWGYGWGLEKNDAGDVIAAFHTGDMGPWRCGVKIDLVSKYVTVFFSKSNYENGHVLQEQIFGQSYALDYFFNKYKFAKSPEELLNDWRQKPSYGIRQEPVQPSQAEKKSDNNIIDKRAHAPRTVFKKPVVNFSFT